MASSDEDRRRTADKLPGLIRVHERYRGKPFADLVIEDYERLGSLELVADELGITLRTFIRYLPRVGLTLEKRLVRVDPDGAEDDGAEDDGAEPAPESVAAAR